MTRDPVVAGQFYEADQARLKKQILEFTNKDIPKKDAIGCIMPHAGYIYSGSVAGITASSIVIKDTCILLGPNHSGQGADFSIMTTDSWQTPFGQIEINQDLSKKILNDTNYLKEDSLAHKYEHSIEVQLPFLKFFNKNLTIVPIIIARSDLETYKKIGRQIAGSIKSLGLENKVLLVASSDMTHYEKEKNAREKDRFAIDAILNLDEEELYKVISKHNITMCGYAPTIIMLCCAKELGAKEAKLIDYRTSAQTSGDYSSVVGYAGIIVS